MHTSNSKHEYTVLTSFLSLKSNLPKERTNQRHKVEHQEENRIMGQCPLSIMPIDDDPSSLYQLADQYCRNNYDEDADIPPGRVSFSTNDTSPEDVESQFLSSEHRFDPSSCILNPKPILAALEYQEMEMERLTCERLKSLSKATTIGSETCGDGDGDGDGQGGAATNNNFEQSTVVGADSGGLPGAANGGGASSTVIGGNASEALTDATRLIGNRDRYAAKRRFRTGITYTGQTITLPQRSSPATTPASTDLPSRSMSMSTSASQRHKPDTIAEEGGGEDSRLDPRAGTEGGGETEAEAEDERTSPRHRGTTDPSFLSMGSFGSAGSCSINSFVISKGEEEAPSSPVNGADGVGGGCSGVMDGDVESMRKRYQSRLGSSFEGAEDGLDYERTDKGLSRPAADDAEEEKNTSPPKSSWLPALLPYFREEKNPLKIEAGSGGTASDALLRLRRPAGPLRLKMKAHMMDFYRNDYLRVFPASPLPRGLERTTDETGLGRGSRGSSPSAALLSRMKQERKLLLSGRLPPGWRGAPWDVDPESGMLPVLLSVDDTPFLDLAMSGSLGLIERAPPLATGDMKVEGRFASPRSVTAIDPPPSPAAVGEQKSPRHYLTLYERSTSMPLAVCALKSPEGDPVVRIYATRPRVSGQRPAAYASDLGLLSPVDRAHAGGGDGDDHHSSPRADNNTPLYAWAELCVYGDFPRPVKYSIYLSAGSDGRFEREPTYRSTHIVSGCPDVMMVGRTRGRGGARSEAEYRGCCTISLRRDASSMKIDEACLEVAVSVGVDPALFLCLAAVVDETVELAMRKHYVNRPGKGSSSRKLRRKF